MLRICGQAASDRTNSLESGIDKVAYNYILKLVLNNMHLYIHNAIISIGLLHVIFLFVSALVSKQSEFYGFYIITIIALLDFSLVFAHHYQFFLIPFSFIASTR